MTCHFKGIIVKKEIVVVATKLEIERLQYNIEGFISCEEIKPELWKIIYEEKEKNVNAL